MTSIQDLLHRIQWDSEFGRASFAIAYLDKVTGGLVRVPFAELRIEPGKPFGFEVAGADGQTRFIPYHRVREVYRDEVLIWQRPERRA